MDEAECYIQHLEQFTSSTKERRQWYDVVVFYNMHGGIPENKNWYEGNVTAAFEELGETNQGILILHHALLAYIGYPVWSDICGIQDRNFKYHIGENVAFNIARNHKITEGINGFTMTDETYTMNEPRTDSEILVTTDHSPSMKSILWTRKYRNSPTAIS